MSEEIKKTEQRVEIQDQDLDTVAGGKQGDPLSGIDVSIGKKPGSTITAQSTMKLPPSRLGGSSAG